MKRILGWVVHGGRSPLGERARPMRGAALLVWVAFIVFPVANAIANPGPEPGHLLAIAAAVGFVALYAWTVVSLFRRGRTALRLTLIVLMAGLAVLLTLADGSGWAFLFAYVAACAAVGVPAPFPFSAVLACTALAAGCALLAGGSGGLALGDAASAAGVGLMMVLLADLRDRNRELIEARAELARAAVARERERFARDLHDLLGHSLSVIAIKAELAGRLLHERADDQAGAAPAAAREVADVEQVARQALNEVRQAVSGYRRPTLDGELKGARMALSAAGIEADFERTPVALDPESEAVLAWAVREGATNVIRHSGARRCRVTISAGRAGAELEVVDDGGAAVAVARAGGHGIAGLAERAERLHGRIEAGRLPEGAGFRLAVSVPSAGDLA